MTYRQPFKGDYPITQRFGEKYTNKDGHTGIDFGCPAGTPILASNDGLVFFAGWKDGGYGYCIFIKHDDGFVTIYEHLLKDIPVAMSQRVLQGQVIGFSGSTGNSTGPHLHFEMRDENGKAFDPMTVLTSVDDRVVAENATTTLKNADAFEEGDTVKVVAPLGAKAFFRGFNDKTAYPQGSRFYYTGKTEKRNGYTYMEVIPLSVPMWVAVHDHETQILDK